MPEDRAASFLQMIRRSSRGRLKIYLGYGPGVGKTYQMLTEAHRLKGDGVDVVVGLVETHNRPQTMKLVEELEVIPRRKMEYRGITIDEMDVDAILARKPTVALVDELAHTNAPDSRNPKRYQDVQELLAAGIHVISTLNVQHLESLYNTVEKLLGVKVRERVPDSVLAEADQVINIDLAAEDLQRRLREGNVYPKDRAASALQNFFTQNNLEHLRELTLREVASQLDFRRREQKSDKGKDGGADQVMVCLSSGGPNSAQLLRYGSRLAGRLDRNWYAVYVQTPSEEPTVIDARVQRLLSDTLTLANQLGATVFTFKGQDVADTLLRFAREYRVAHVIIGRPRAQKWWHRLIGKTSVADQMIRRSSGVSVIVVNLEAEQEEKPPAHPAEETPVTGVSSTAKPPRPGIVDLLAADRIRVWSDPVSKADIFKSLAGAATNGDVAAAEKIAQKLNEREASGSTFLNEGVALPHARVDELTEPVIALGLTQAGVLDVPSTQPIEVVFMLLSPTAGASKHLQILAKAGRLLQNRQLRRRLGKCRDADQAMELLRSWDGE